MTTAAALVVPRAATGASFVRRLSDDLDEPVAGGKAAVLSALLRRGLPVPDGCVLTVDAFAAFLDTEGLRARIAHLLAAHSGERFDGVADAVHDLVMTSPLPRHVDEAVHATAAMLAGGAVVVRSSAVGEDGGVASYAGQFDSVVDVATKVELFRAVRSCWASYWSARALAYRDLRSLPSAPMAVLIQRQVHARAAGVLFTRSPQPGLAPADAMIVEYTAGLADGLVSGRVDPGRLFIARADRRVAHDAEPEEHDARTTVERLAPSLAALGVRLEQDLGGPQDVEWAIDADDRLWVVQSRPITTGAHDPEPASSGAAPIVWSNANVSENFPEPLSPLLYSIATAGYYHYFRNLGLAFGVSRRRLDAMDPAFRTIVGVHGARLYYNLTNIHAVLRLVPFGDRLTRAFNLFVGASESTRSDTRAHEWSGRRDSWRQTGEAAWMAVCVVWQFALLDRRLRRFEAEADAYARRTEHGVLNGRSLRSLGDDLMAFVGIRCHRWKNASLCDAAAMLGDAALGRLLRAARIDAAAKTRLLRAVPGAPSSEPALQLWALSRRVRQQAALRQQFADASPDTLRARLAQQPELGAFARELDAYLATWGFRSSGELMLTRPTLEEEPEPALALIRQYAETDGDDPRDVIRRQAGMRREETRAAFRLFLRRAPLLSLPFLAVLHWTQRAIVARERARLKQALLYTRCRRVALAIGSALHASGRIASTEDVFMLTWQELDEVCAGRSLHPDGLRELLRVRRTTHASVCAQQPPDTVVLADGERWRVRHTSDAEAVGRPMEADSSDLRGVTACGGRVSAPAAVLAGVHEAERLSRGDVLVTRQTDPGWAPVFCLVSGLVIERGGLLSHGAIIAREFGVPCLVGVKGATRRIAHGSWLIIDADQGSCRVEPAR